MLEDGYAVRRKKLFKIESYGRSWLGGTRYAERKLIQDGAG